MRWTLACGPLAAVFLSTTMLSAGAAEVFNRTAIFATVQNLAEADQGKESVAEIISATEDGMMLVYTDSPQEGVGFVDITDVKAPKAAGFVKLQGEPTSVKVVGGKALVGVVTSPSKDKPSGHVAVIDLASKAVEATCDLAGQPDSVAVSKDKAFLAIAIENERDEEVNDGAIPQLPGGDLAILPLKDGTPDCASLKRVDLTGLAAVAPEDPEPEFVSINGRNQAVVTLQENNHIAVVDLATAKVVSQFSAGTVSLTGIDTEKNGAIELTGTMEDVAREPDGVVWLDDERFVTANEGDWKGGTRGFSIFKADGTVLFDAGNTLEHELVSLGHYNDKRNKKGVEIEGVEAGTFGAVRLIFVASERASAVAVYKDTGAAPELLQVLPSGIGPEGVLALPQRNLLVTANETDLVEDGGVRAHVMIYERGEGAPAYPTIRSAAADPIPFGALSGLTADRSAAGTLYAVTDSIYGAAPPSDDRRDGNARDHHRGEDRDQGRRHRREPRSGGHRGPGGRGLLARLGGRPEEGAEEPSPEGVGRRRRGRGDRASRVDHRRGDRIGPGRRDRLRIGRCGDRLARRPARVEGRRQGRGEAPLLQAGHQGVGLRALSAGEGA